MGPSHNFRFYATCISSGDGKAIQEMVDGGRSITRRTFLKWVDLDEMAEIETDLGYGPWLKMAKDWYVSYNKGRYKGVPAVWFTWSAIEHIFVAEEAMDVLDEESRRRT